MSVSVREGCDCVRGRGVCVSLGVSVRLCEREGCVCVSLCVCVREMCVCECLCVRDLCALTLMRLRKSKYAPQLSELHGVNKNKVYLCTCCLSLHARGKKHRR